MGTDVGHSTDLDIYEDNQGCIELKASEKMNARMKHIDICHHHHRVRDLVDRDVSVH